MCKCIAKVNAHLAEYNAGIETNLLANPPRCLVSLYKLAPRGKKPPFMEATFCPFCGKKYIGQRRDTAKLTEARP